ncbi:MAG: ABC transporter permease [Bulleidia sp.]
MTETKKKKTWHLTDDKPFEALRILASIAVALIVTFIVLCFVSDQPLHDFVQLLILPLTKSNYFGYVLVKVVPLTFAGLATLLYFRMGLFNLGTEGVFYFAGVVATYFATGAVFSTGNTVIDSLVPIVMAGIAGGLLSLLPGYLNAKFGTDEMVISLMLNNILYGVGFWIVKTFLAISGTTGTSSAPFTDSARLETIIPKTQVHSGLIIALAMVVFVWILLYKTKLGYSIRISGSNPKFALYSGMGAFGTFMLVHFIAGAIGGVGSAVELLGMYKAFTWSTLPGLGFSGAMITMLGKNDPIGVLVASFGISYLRASAQLLANSTPYIDIKMISIVEVILTLLISSQFFLQRWRSRKLLKQEKEAEKHAG